MFLDRKASTNIQNIAWLGGFCFFPVKSRDSGFSLSGETFGLLEPDMCQAEVGGFITLVFRIFLENRVFQKTAKHERNHGFHCKKNHLGNLLHSFCLIKMHVFGQKGFEKYTKYCMARRILFLKCKFLLIFHGFCHKI